MRKIITWLLGGAIAVVAAATLIAAPSSASASGLSPGALGEQGWLCLDAVHAVHCVPPGLKANVFNEQAEAFTALVFDTRDPADQDAAFLGTEFNIRADLFHGQRCPTDPPTGQYTYLPEIRVPLNYYACHRFDSPL